MNKNKNYLKLFIHDKSILITLTSFGCEIFVADQPDGQKNGNEYPKFK